jgi:hypothetical protein
MSDSRWQRIEEIFHQAAELAPKARPAFLDQACTGDEALRKEIETLLAHDAEEGGTLAKAVAEAGVGRTRCWGAWAQVAWAWCTRRAIPAWAATWR